MPHPKPTATQSLPPIQKHIHGNLRRALVEHLRYTEEHSPVFNIQTHHAIVDREAGAKIEDIIIALDTFVQDKVEELIENRVTQRLDEIIHHKMGQIMKHYDLVPKRVKETA
jgi:hypothetical protein